MNEDDLPELSREPLVTALQKVEGYFIPLERLKFQSKTIGSGAFGVVKLAELIPQDANVAPSIIVAIKDLQDISRGVNPLRVAYRLAREMTVWSSLRHGNILEFVGYHLSEDFLVAYLVSPYMRNGNVKDYLRKTQTTLEERLELVRDTALGLEYLHTRAPPVVHGDLKALPWDVGAQHEKAIKSPL
ncbi:hypothetical protein FS837_012729 [Tulasnella sp. UAMH 9824]|nr:hypothetical protein FS837_012729 [Tulasnella sp. UAMH 9824]